MNAESFFVDGTFKIAPPLFSQVYVISGEKCGGVHPLLYALLPNKLRGTYSKLFDMILELKPDFNPSVINCNFEMADSNSLKMHFPSVEIRGCFFHLTQNMKKHVLALGYSQQYRNNAEVNLRCKMVCTLAFIPIDDIEDAILQLSHQLSDDQQEFLDWCEDTYVGRMDRRTRIRRDPRFPHVMCNLFQRFLSNEDRTNNQAEVANRRLQCELEMQQPSIWKIIDALRKVQRGRDLYYEQLFAGYNPTV